MPFADNPYLLAADALLLIHFGFALFIVAGTALVWLGYWAKWRIICRPIWRICHLAAMGFVLIESLLGLICPLTRWETALRIAAGGGQVYQTSFIQTWVHRILFFDITLQSLAVIYGLVFCLILLAWWVAPPIFGAQKKSE
jgi:hypothetical protein